MFNVVQVKQHETTIIVGMPLMSLSSLQPLLPCNVGPDLLFTVKSLRATVARNRPSSQVTMELFVRIPNGPGSNHLGV